MRKTINIDFDNSSSIILGYDPNILSLSSSGFAASTHIHGGVNLELTNITGSYTSVSNGLTLALEAGSIGGNVVAAGSNITLSTSGGTTTVSVTNVALADHAHGTFPSVSGNIAGTISSNGWSLSIPDFLLTAAESDHTHSYAGLGTTTATTSSNLLKVTLNTDGISMRVPNFLTTAADLTHTHGSFLGTNITQVSSGSGGLALSVAHKLGTNTSSNTISGTDFIMAGNSSGLTVSMPKFITTAPDVTHIHGSISTVSTDGSVLLYSSASSGLSLSIPAWVTDGGAGGNNLVLSGNTTGTTAEMSSGTVSIAGGNNITLSQDGNAFTIIGAASGTDPGIAFSLSTINTAGTKTLIDAGTLYMQGGNNITLSQNSNTIDFVGAVGIGFTSTTATTLAGTLSSNGLLLGMPTYMASDAGSNFPGLGSSIEGGDMTYNTNGLTISIDPAGAYTGIFGIADSAASTVTEGTVQFANGNGISFGLNGSTITASYDSNAYIGTAYLGYYQATNDNSLSAGASHSHGSLFTSSITGSVVTNASNSSGLTLGIPAFITTNINHTHGSIFTSSITGSDITNSSASSGITLGIPAYAVTSHTHSNLYPTIGHTHGSNISFSTTNLLGASASSASNGLTLSISGYPASSFVNTSDAGNIYFANSLGSNITWGTTTSAGNITYIGATAGGGSAGGGIAASIGSGGNSTSAGSGFSNISTGTLYLIGGSNITLSQNGEYITIVGPTAGGAQTGISSIAASNTTYTSGMIIFSAQANVTIGTSVTSNSQYIRISANPSANFSLLGNVTGNSTASGSTIGLVGGTNITLSGLNNSQIRIDGPVGNVSFADSYGVSFGTVTSVSTNQTVVTASIAPVGGGAGTGTTIGTTSGTDLKMTLNATGLNISHPNWLTTQTGQIISASNGSYTYSALSFGTENNVTFYTTEAGGFPSIAASINAGGPLVSYSGTISVTDGLLSVNTDGYHEIQVGSINKTDSGTHYFVHNSIDLYENVFENYEFRVNSDSSLASESLGWMVLLTNGPHFGQWENIYNSTDTGISTHNAVEVALNISNGLYYSNYTDNNVSYSSGWTTFSNWIPNKKYVDDQISTITVGGGGNWELEGTKTAGTTASAFDTLFLQGGNNITLSGNSNTIVFSVADAAGQSQQPMYFSGSNGESSASTITFGNLNNLSHYVSNGSVVGSFATSLRQYFYGNTATNGVSSQSATNIAFKGGSNITLSVGTDKQIEIIGPTQITNYAASDHTHSNLYIPLANSTQYATSVLSNTFAKTDFTYSHSHPYIGTNTSISSGYGGSTLAMSANTSGITLSVPAWVTAASGGGGGVALGNTATVPFTSGSVMISGSGLTVNTSADGASQWLQIQAPAIGYLYFSNTNGHSWSSATSGASTSIYIITA